MTGLVITLLLLLELCAIYAVFEFLDQVFGAISDPPVLDVFIRLRVTIATMVGLIIGFFCLILVSRRGRCFSRVQRSLCGLIALALLAVLGLSLPFNMDGAEPLGMALLWLYILHFALSPVLMLLALREDKRRDAAGLAATG